MLELEEKATHKLPVSLPKTKHGATDDMEDGEATKEQTEEEYGDYTKADEALQGHMHPQLQR